MSAGRLSKLVGDGVEIAAEGREDDHGYADRIALAKIVRSIGVRGVVEALRDGADTLAGLPDAVQMTTEEQAALRELVDIFADASIRILDTRFKARPKAPQ